MTPADKLKLLRKAMGRATEGPWSSEDWMIATRKKHVVDEHVADASSHADAAAIVALRNNADALFDAVEAAIDYVWEFKPGERYDQWRKMRDALERLGEA